MASVNKVILVGHLGKDPEVKHSSDGNRIVNFSIATNESWIDKASGTRKIRTEWHKIVIFNDKLAEIAEKYLKSGSRVYLEGQLNTRKYTNLNKVETSVTEIVLPRFKGELVLMDNRSLDNLSSYNLEEKKQEELPMRKIDFKEILDDEVPF